MATGADDTPVSARRRFRTGTGEIVPRAYERARARQHFLMVFAAMIPEAIDCLFSPDTVTAYQIALQHTEYADLDAQITPAVQLYAIDVVEWLIRDWQRRAHLPDEWCRAAIRRALDVAVLNGVETLRDKWYVPIGYADACADLYEGKAPESQQTGPTTFTFHPERLVRTRSVWLDDLKHPDGEHDEGVEEEGAFGTFDPRAEPIDDAVKRLMPELETRLRWALAQMVADDTAGDTVRVRNLPPVHHFAWAVRYQCGGESYPAIAADPHTGTDKDVVDDRGVSRAVRNVANLIGLTLRPPSPAGRPRKPRARCIKVAPCPK